MFLLIIVFNLNGIPTPPAVRMMMTWKFNIFKVTIMCGLGGMERVIVAVKFSLLRSWVFDDHVTS